MRKIAVLSLLLTLVSAQNIQKNNVRFVGQKAYGSSSDVWGYTAPDGHEFALLGLGSGTAILDVTSDPSNPSEVGFIPGESSGWRDLKTHSHYCYVTNETGGGIDIIDLEDPFNPILIGKYRGTFSSAHNLFIADGYAYIFGSNTGAGGVRILDLSNPEIPEEVGSWEVEYIHDGYVKNDTLYVSGIYSGTLYIVDVSDKTNPKTMVTHKYSNYGSHAVWVTDDSKYAITVDEKSHGYVNIWDIQNFENINLVSSYEVGTTKSVHNVFYKDQLLYISYYIYGTRIVDISDPVNPKEVGYLDAYPGDLGTYNGNWGTYPYTNSGLIFSSYMNGAGLIIMSYPYYGDITYDRLRDTEAVNTSYPITVQVQENQDTPIDYASLQVIAGLNGVFQDSTTLTPTGGLDEYSGSIPASLSAGVMHYYVSFNTTDGREVTQPYGAPLSNYTFNVGPDMVLPQVDYITEAEDDFYPTGSRTIGVRAHDNIGISKVDIIWRVNGGAEHSTGTAYNDTDDTYWGEITWDKLNTGDVITYWTKITDSSSNQNITNSAEYTIIILDDYIIGNFERVEKLLLWDLGQWGRQFINEDYQYGLNDSPMGKYEPNANNPCSLIEPLNLTYFNQAYLAFTSLHVLEPDKDFGYVQISTDGTNWKSEAIVTGVWVVEDMVISLDEYLNEDQVYLRFLMTSDSVNQHQGWFIDDVHLVLNKDLPEVGIDDDLSPVPDQVRLYPNYPNPFNASTTITYHLPTRSQVTLRVYDLFGRTVRTLVDSPVRAGAHSIVWEGTNDDGKAAGAGMYLARIQTDSYSETQKMILLK